MKAAQLTLEMTKIRIRTHRLVGISLGIHVLLLLWFTLIPKITYKDETLTEITWLEPAPVVPPTLTAAFVKAKPVERHYIPPEKPSIHEKREHFKREHPIADIVLKPQSKILVEDKLEKRLAVLQRKTREKPTKVITVSPSNAVDRPTLAGVAITVNSNTPPKELTRHKPTGSAPIELKRSPEKIQKATMLMTSVPEKTIAPVELDRSDTQTQRTIAGASLVGPVADRPLISYTKPEYPEWAKREVVEGSVTIYFVVMPNGKIKNNVVVQKTSGFGDFDENAMKALLVWHFEALEKGSMGEQWGTITFHYRLSDS